jgi:hypothetical protein
MPRNEPLRCEQTTPTQLSRKRTGRAIPIAQLGLAALLALGISPSALAAAPAPSSTSDEASGYTFAPPLWIAQFEELIASGTKICDVTAVEAGVRKVSRDAPTERIVREVGIKVRLYERERQSDQFITVGLNAYPQTARWANVDAQARFSTSEEMFSTEVSAKLLTEMLIGGVIYIEWIEWPTRTVQQKKVGLGHFAEAYADCRTKMGWPIPEGVRRIVEERRRKREEIRDGLALPPEGGEGPGVSEPEPPPLLWSSR